MSLDAPNLNLQPAPSPVPEPNPPSSDMMCAQESSSRPVPVPNPSASFEDNLDLVSGLQRQTLPPPGSHNYLFEQLPTVQSPGLDREIQNFEYNSKCDGIVEDAPSSLGFSVSPLNSSMRDFFEGFSGAGSSSVHLISLEAGDTSNACGSNGELDTSNLAGEPHLPGDSSSPNQQLEPAQEVALLEAEVLKLSTSMASSLSVETAEVAVDQISQVDLASNEPPLAHSGVSRSYLVFAVCTFEAWMQPFQL